MLFVEKRGGRVMPIDAPKGAVSTETLDLPALRETITEMDGGGDFSAFEVEPMSVSYSVTHSGLLEGGGVRRFTEGDREGAIPVIADISTPPSGVSESEAMTALRNAFSRDSLWVCDSGSSQTRPGERDNSGGSLGP